MSDLLERLNKTYVDGTPHMRDIGLRIVSVDSARGTMVLPPRADWVGDPQRGRMHAGPLIVLADSACGIAVGAALPSRNITYATLDLRLDWLRPASTQQPVYSEAHCYRLTRSVAFIRAEVWQADRSQPVASVQSAFMLGTPSRARTASIDPNAAAATAAPANTSPDPTWQAPSESEPVLPGQLIPYVEYLGIRVVPHSRSPVFRMPFQPRLIGNPNLPALHGGVVAGFAETAALLQLMQSLQGAKQPKSIDFSVDYLRSGRPEECFAQCNVVRLGGRVALVTVRVWQRSPELPIAVARGHFLLATR
ncbi:MAG: PaaI family thioesterase [Burkholderiales bacterium]